MLHLTNQRVYQELVYGIEVLKTMATDALILSLPSPHAVFMQFFLILFPYCLGAWIWLTRYQHCNIDILWRAKHIFIIQQGLVATLLGALSSPLQFSLPQTCSPSGKWPRKWKTDMIFSLSEGKIRLWSFTTTDHIQDAVKFEIGKLTGLGLISWSDCLSHEPSLVALAPTSLSSLCGRASGLV